MLKKREECFNHVICIPHLVSLESPFLSMCSNMQSFKTIIFYPSKPAANSLVPTSMSFHSKKMQERENRNSNNPQPLGICQRLLNFIMNIIAAQGLPRPTNPPASQSIPVPVEGSSAFREEPEYHLGNSNSEIRVDFRHTNGLEHHVPKNENAIVNGKKGGFRPVEIGIVRPTRNAEIDSRGQVNGQELNSITAGESRGKLPTKVGSINDHGGDKEKNNNKDKDTQMMPPFDFLENDINGRADEFIRQKKNDFLRRNLTLDLPKSS